MSKPNKDGWIRHRGGKSPVPADSKVLVRYRCGVEAEIVNFPFCVLSKSITWKHLGKFDRGGSDIMAYKLLEAPVSP